MLRLGWDGEVFGLCRLDGPSWSAYFPCRLGSGLHQEIICNELLMREKGAGQRVLIECLLTNLIMLMYALICVHTRYSRTQIASVLLVTGGVISATLSSHGPSSLSSSSSSSSSDVGAYATGVALLSLALVLSGLMGLYQERTFRRYGSGHWRESLFYSHLLSLPLFALRAKGLAAELRAANASAPVWLGLGPASVSARLSAVRAYDFAALAGLGGAFSKTAGFSGIGFALPSFYVPLTLNVLTQLLCINGVNRLTARVSSLTVTLVLVVRKAASLAISVVILGGSTGNPGLWLGAAAVLLGTVGYSLGSRKAAPSRPAPDEKRAAITAAADADAETGTEMSDGSAVPKDGARIEANQSANEENARRQLNGASTALDKTNGSSKRRGTRS